MADQSTTPPVGIDLGTTFSVVAHLDAQGRPWTIANAEGDLTTPSIVFFDEGAVIVGKEAARAAEFDPDRAASFSKRQMGDQFLDREIVGRQFPPEVIQALILKKVREDAALKLGEFTRVVVTVPAFFNEPRRRRTQDAGRMAGLDVLDIINEPTAAAIAYGVQQQFLDEQGRSRKRETVLIYDLGGGTFDVTLLEIDGGQYTARATAGDVYLGGIDWDQRIADFVAERFMAEHDVDPRQDAVALQSLRQAAEDAKRTLSARERTTLRFASEGQRIQADLSRDQFEELTGDLLDRTLLTVRRVLREAACSWDDVDRLLLVGGSSRMPAVQRMLEAESGMPVDRCLSPDESVAHGAAIYAGLLVDGDAAGIQGMSVRNVNSHHLGVLGVERSTGRRRRQIMVPRNTLLPAESTYDFKTLEEGQSSVQVNVIEGGDDSGNDATPIGRCVVSGLPAGLPTGTRVDVRFRYETNGRLAVTAWVPSAEKQAELTIHRADGLSTAEIEQWSSWIEAGSGEAVPAADPGTVPTLELAPDAEGQPAAAPEPVTEDAEPPVTAPSGWKSRRVQVTAGDEESPS